MRINKEVISKLNPCKDRFDNFVKFYGNKDFTSVQFMGLKNITQADKMWVAFRLMPKDKIRLAAADIAETVLHLYEQRYPTDRRPRRAIEATRTGDRNAAYAAAYAAYAAANAYAANAAYAAAYAAYAAANAANAAYAAAYAANAAYAAANAAYAAAYGTGNRSVQEKLIRKICLKYLK